MKYLEKFNWFKRTPQIKKEDPKPLLPQDIVDTLYDICLELKDDGFNTIISLNHYRLEITKRRQASAGGVGNYLYPENVELSEIIDTVDRISRYMEQMGYTTEIKKDNPYRFDVTFTKKDS